MIEKLSKVMSDILPNISLRMQINFFFVHLDCQLPMAVFSFSSLISLDIVQLDKPGSWQDHMTLCLNH